MCVCLYGKAIWDAVSASACYSKTKRAKYLRIALHVVVRLDAESFPKPIRSIDIFAKLKANEKPERRARVRSANVNNKKRQKEKRIAAVHQLIEQRQRAAAASTVWSRYKLKIIC